MASIEDEHKAAREYIGGLSRTPQALADALRQLTGAREVAVRYDVRTEDGLLRTDGVAISTRPLPPRDEQPGIERLITVQGETRAQRVDNSQQ